MSDSGDLPEKPPVYVSAEEVKEEKVNEPRKKVAWWHMSKWTPLMWIQVVSFFPFTLLCEAMADFIMIALLPRSPNFYAYLDYLPDILYPLATPFPLQEEVS